MEIKFRGKSVKTGVWVYGYYFKCDWHEYQHKIRVQKDKHFIDIAVTFKTIGMRSGFKDKNKNEIWEGDSCFDNDSEDEGVITFNNGCFYFEHENIIEQLSEVNDALEVIGNKFDNKNL